MKWSGKRVLLTGHTGFKGGWLAVWLQELGADLCGLALDPPSVPNLFEEARVEQGMRSITGDIRDASLVKSVIADCRPEIVFHLAAQPLVRASYSDPLGTYATNVMGTAHVLDAIRQIDTVRAVVVVTTDKCYENREWLWPYRESDALGGYDPYSNSKACAELVAAAYRSSFFPPASYMQHGVALATARGGNVIGGGDWAEDRLIPDMMRAFTAATPVRIRNPHAIRPWQHVLELVRGYILLAEALYERGSEYGEAWNFGPDQSDARPVEWIVRQLVEMWGEGASWEIDGGVQPHEAQTLKLECSKAAARLGWRPGIDLRKALQMTTEWYQAKRNGMSMRGVTAAQIEHYRSLVENGTVL